MVAKCELKQYIADEAEKEKKTLELKIEQFQLQVKELTEGNEIHEQLKNIETGKKHEWANLTYRNMMPPDAALMLFEAYKC